MTPAVPLITRRDRLEARRLVESLGLTSEEQIDDVVGIYEDARLVATASRSGFVLKMFAIDPGYQGSEVLGELVTALLELGRSAGQETCFVYTRPEHAGSFEHLNFRLLVASSSVALLEFGPGIEEFLRRSAPLRRPGRNGAAVVNGNPFTLGHQYLVETAAREVDSFYLFVVREDRSVFPFSARFRLALEATAHIPNVMVLDSSRYAVSGGTFPSYFLRRCDDRAREQMQIDVRLFGQHLAPPFSVSTRFVGHEPYSPMTAAYNLVMAEILPEYGIGLTEVPRRRLEDATAGQEFISATRVRSAFAKGAFDRLSRLVPRSTLDYLRSAEGEAIRRRLLAEDAAGGAPPNLAGRNGKNREATQPGDQDGNPQESHRRNDAVE